MNAAGRTTGINQGTKTNAKHAVQPLPYDYAALEPHINNCFDRSSNAAAKRDWEDEGGQLQGTES